MTAKDQLNILDRKIKQKNTDYDLYRQNAEISALSSGDLDKYEYITKQYLNSKPDPLQKAKFVYSPFGQVFNKGLDKDKKQEGLLKRIKNLEDTADNQLLVIEDQGNRQLDLNDKIRIRIGFNSNKRLRKLEKEIKDKELEIRKNKRIKK